MLVFIYNKNNFRVKKKKGKYFINNNLKKVYRKKFRLREIFL